MEIAIVRMHPAQVQRLVVVLLKLSPWTACHRFSVLAVLAVLAALPPTLTGDSTAAPPHSVDLCLVPRRIGSRQLCREFLLAGTVDSVALDPREGALPPV